MQKPVKIFGILTLLMLFGGSIQLFWPQIGRNMIQTLQNFSSDSEQNTIKSAVNLQKKSSDNTSLLEADLPFLETFRLALTAVRVETDARYIIFSRMRENKMAAYKEFIIP